MAVTLIINPGSSSKKYVLAREGRVVLTVRYERIGKTVELCTVVDGTLQKCEMVTEANYRDAVQGVIAIAIRENQITDSTDIERVGIRIVAPSSYFQEHRRIDEHFISQLRDRSEAAPLHIPPTLHEIEHVARLLPTAQLVGVSDSAFHASIPSRARNYSIPTSDTEQYDVHRFGYHGLSYASITRKLESLYGYTPNRVVICHIGSGVSMTALHNGKSIDTTMGFSPVSGLIMGTRAGDVEAGALLELMRVKKMNAVEAQTYLQTEGGLKGLTGEADLRYLLERSTHHDGVATEALAKFIYHIQKALGSFAVALGGLDAIILTATAAERSTVLRSMLLQNMAWLGIELDEKRNEDLNGGDGIISSSASKVSLAVIKTNEQGEMLRIVDSLSE